MIKSLCARCELRTKIYQVFESYLNNGLFSFIREVILVTERLYITISLENNNYFISFEITNPEESMPCSQTLQTDYIPMDSGHQYLIEMA
ncbi:hypothetical protein BpHYR1_029327 [Brachionus plicatilis]|uniref:Uncharacterized protein n=1 Tax=Brachionus plicatilis TaxID=10195 RepID=A0A3M7S5W8_BRAPC|nr:hypothetical protein BpHYR1_029327 [Brachionus plicatilis]